MISLTPYMTYVKIAVVLGAAVSGGLIGYKIGTAKFKDYQINAAKQETAEVLHDSRVAQVTLTKYVDRIVYIEKKVDPIIQEVIHEVEKPIYSECVIPESGRMLLNSAIAQANTAGEFDGDVQ